MEEQSDGHRKSANAGHLEFSEHEYHDLNPMFTPEVIADNARRAAERSTPASLEGEYYAAPGHRAAGQEIIIADHILQQQKQIMRPFLADSPKGAIYGPGITIFTTEIALIPVIYDEGTDGKSGRLPSLFS